MTDFQSCVYQMLQSVPAGKVVTYQDLAIMIGKPNAVRAVGTALARNTRIGIIPCHRVVRSSGSIGQFALGTKKKVQMLQAEGVIVENGLVDLSLHRYEPQHA